MSSRLQLLAGLSLAVAPFVSPFPALAQTDLPPAGARAAGVNEVTVELTAHDRKGGAISDLTIADVAITDGGAPVSLTGLRLARQTRQTISFVFDDVVPGVAKTDRDLAGEVLAGVAGHGYQFAVFKVEKRLHLVQAPTADVEAVKAAIEAATMAKRPDYIQATEAAEKRMTEDIGSAAGPRQATAKMLLAMLQDSQKTAGSDAQSTPSVAALLALARGQMDVPGRKSILYFSQGLDWKKQSAETLRSIRDEANRERATFYSFDAEIGDTSAAQSLNFAAQMGTMQAEGRLPGSPGVAGPGDIDPALTTQSYEFTSRMRAGDGGSMLSSLADLCASTGGTHVFAVTEGHKGAGEIVTDLNSYYLASWISPAAANDAHARPIGVRSLRKGVLVASRAGYFLPRRDPSKLSAFEGRLTEALAAPKLAADLPMRAALLQFGNTPDSQVNSVAVEVPLDRVEIKDGQSGVSVLAQLKDRSGAVVEKFSADISPRRTAGAPGQMATDMVSFRRQFSAPPGEYVLESAAMDSNGGKIGARRADVTIPAVENGLALGDVLLVRRFDAAGPAGDADPLRCAEGVVVPNLSGRVAKAAGPKIHLFFDLRTDPASPAAPTLSAELRRRDDLIGTMPLKMPADPQRKTIPYLTTLGATDLKPGQYEMTVILRQGGRRVSKSVSFTLE